MECQMYDHVIEFYDEEINQGFKSALSCLRLIRWL